MEILIKYFKILFIIIPIGYSAQINIVGSDKILFTYSSIRTLNYIESNNDSCTYLYSQISYPTGEEGEPFNINGKLYPLKIYKEQLWISKINNKGDTLYTKILPNIPEFRMTLAASVKNGVLYFLLSNSYAEGERTRNGCLFVRYDPKTDKLLCQQVYADPYGSNSFFIKDDSSFYLIVDDVPHLCIPPEYNIYLLKLNNSGVAISKKLLTKTICQGGEYSPGMVYINKAKKQFYLMDADFFTGNTAAKNSCNLNLFDVYEKKNIPYTSYKRYISFFNLTTSKRIKRMNFECDRNIVGFLNDSEYVSLYTNTAKDRITFLFTDLKKRNRKELEIKTNDWHAIKLVGKDLFILGFSGNNVNIKRIRNKALVANNDYVITNYKDQYGNNITPIVLKDRIRFFYTRDGADSKEEISYFDEMNVP